MGHAETFDHTADLGLRVTASDLPDLFRTAAAGLFDVIVANRDEVRPVESETVAINAESASDLLLAWLNELIFRCETRHRLYRRFEPLIREESGVFHLNAEIAGEPIDRDRHILDHEVKAATHHGLSLQQVDGEWQAEVIVDI